MEIFARWGLLTIIILAWYLGGGAIWSFVGGLDPLPQVSIYSGGIAALWLILRSIYHSALDEAKDEGKKEQEYRYIGQMGMVELYAKVDSERAEDIAHAFLSFYDERYEAMYQKEVALRKERSESGVI